MVYKSLAPYYDRLNSDADYDALSEFIRRRLSFFRMHGCTVVDLCCGTGELTMRLAKSGYDMIAVDYSSDMLSVLSSKLYESDIKGVLLLNQDARELDLFGTVDCVISTFDALNHIGEMGELDKVFNRVNTFLNRQGLFIFDMNTPYKHTNILANNSFKYDFNENVSCFVSHTLHEGYTDSAINLFTGEYSHVDVLREYYFSKGEITKLCERNGFRVVSCIDGESFDKLTPESQRFMFTVQKTTN